MNGSLLRDGPHDRFDKNGAIARSRLRRARGLSWAVAVMKSPCLFAVLMAVMSLASAATHAATDPSAGRTSLHAGAKRGEPGAQHWLGAKLEHRSAERRLGKGCVSTMKSRWARHQKKK